MHCFEMFYCVENNYFAVESHFSSNKSTYLLGPLRYWISLGMIPSFWFSVDYSLLLVVLDLVGKKRCRRVIKMSWRTETKIDDWLISLIGGSKINLSKISVEKWMIWLSQWRVSLVRNFKNTFLVRNFLT